MSLIARVCLETLEQRRLLAASTGVGPIGVDPIEVVGPTSGVTASAVAPRTTGVFFSAGSQNSVDRDSAVLLQIQFGDGGGVKETSLLRGQFAIFEDGSQTAVTTGNVQTSGGGDVLQVKPTTLLKANTNYTVQFNQRNDLSKITDVSNQAFVAATYTFKTNSTFQQPDPNIKFTQQVVKTRNTNGSFSAVTIGPGNRLYAGTLEGYIYRWDINADGTLGNEQRLDIVRNSNGGNRFITGLTFDPRSTDPANPVLWVSHGQAKFGDTPSFGSGQDKYADNYTGKISRLYGNDLGTYQDVIIDIPRSVKDHLNNQITFDPVAKSLYFLVPSHSAMGRADPTWGNRAEEINTAAIFRLQLRTRGDRVGIEEWLADRGPISMNSTTSNYNYFKGTNPLRFYATGIRNAYDMVFHSNGRLYVPGNSSAAGGNTPTDPNQAGTNITGVEQFIEDFLFDVEEGGYYGHPNPTRGEYVLNGGNPTSTRDPFQINEYPAGTQPDADYRAPAFDFGKNQSPNGAIEYQGNAFGGLLKGALIVARYSSGDDLTVLFPDENGVINSNDEKLGITGFTGFTDNTGTGGADTSNPLDLVEDTRNGNIYVISLVDRYGKGAITLLKPITGQAGADQTRLRYFATAGDTNGTTKQVTLSNTANQGDLTVDVSAIRITGKDRRNFVVSNLPTEDFTLAPGETFTFDVKFVAPAGDSALKYGNLAIATTDPDALYTVVQLRGSGVVPAPASTPIVTTPAAKTARAVVPTVAPSMSIRQRNLYFNAVQGSTDTQILRITNEGDANLDIVPGGIEILGGARARFSIGNFNNDTGFSIKPGRRLDLEVTFTARESDDLSIKEARIVIVSTDPVTPAVAIGLRALPTSGIGGSNEPSLQKVLDTFGLPINVGDNTPDEYQLGTPNANSQEVLAQQFVKAGNGPVSIRPLAVFGTDNGPAARLGIYAPGEADALQPLWYVPQEDAQSVNPIVYGQTLVDPGSAPFGVFGEFPGFTNANGGRRYVYSEDQLNSVWEVGSSNLRKLRYYPLIDQNGNVAPNTYVGAFEEFTKEYDYQDLVFVISNVTPYAVEAPRIAVQPLNGAPVSSNVVFNKVENPDPVAPNVTRLTNVIRVSNTGNTPLIVSFSTTGNFSIDKNGGTNVTIAPGERRDVTLRFTASSGTLHSGSFNISSNDPTRPNVSVPLKGWWQEYSEFTPDKKKSLEPSIKTIINDLFGFTTRMTNDGQALSTKGRVATTGDEVLVPYWRQADDNGPIRVTALATFKFQADVDKNGNFFPSSETVGWFTPNNPSEVNSFLFSAKGDGQSVLPRKNSPLSSVMSGTFKPSSDVFGFVVERTEYSDPTLNPDSQDRTGYGHFVRFWPVYDAQGMAVPNTYIMLHDYNRDFSNYDYQDGVFLVENIVPADNLKTPLTVFAEETSKGARISFTSPATGPKIYGFNVYRSSDPRGPWELITPTPLDRRPVTTFIDEAVTADQTFYYQITSVGVSGDESAPTTVVI